MPLRKAQCHHNENLERFRKFAERLSHVASKGWCKLHGLYNSLQGKAPGEGTELDATWKQERKNSLCPAKWTASAYSWIDMKFVWEQHNLEKIKSISKYAFFF